MYKFGKISREKLGTAHSDLTKIMELALARSKVDFGISEGNRSVIRQLQLFNEGKSMIDGINKHSKHNYTPSMAVDIYVYHPDLETRRKLAYDKVHLAYLAGVIAACAAELFDCGKVNHKLRWGANWDSDGVIYFDQSFDDYPHFELIEKSDEK